MMTNRKIFQTAYFSSLIAFVLSIVPRAQAQTTAWTGACVGTSTAAADVATIQGIGCLVSNVLAVFITIIGIAAFIMFLMGSFQYMTAGSNSKGIDAGKNAITYAIIGIVVALASYVILRFISDFTGITALTQFKISL